MSKKTYQDLVHLYGKWDQCFQACEELAELIQAISKVRRYPGNLKHEDDVAEEMADVMIMLEQLELIFNNGERIKQYKQVKLQKLNALIRQEKELRSMVGKASET